ncbi:MAG: tyrosine-type recombinase/integrase [Clostridiaceae bacterium]
MKEENKKVSIEVLKNDLFQELENHSYSPGTMELYSGVLNRIQTYMVQNELTLYSPEVGKAFLENDICKKSYEKHTLRFFKTVIRRLDDCYFERGFVLSIPRKNLSVQESFQGVLDSYYKHCINVGNSDTTLKMKERACHAFCTNINATGCQDFSSLDIHIVSKAVLMEKNLEYWPCIKDLLLYLALAEVTLSDFSTIVPKNRRGIKLPSIYNNKEIYSLEQAVNRTTAPGKRNYAMILLASRLGIRAGDIAGLHLADLDFQTKRIHFIQHKTGIPTDLIMLPEIKEALTDYITAERPESDLDLVFLSAFAPYWKISYSVVSYTVKKYMKLAGIDTAGKKHGPHSLRSSLATSMVNDGINYDSVRKILGHEGANAIKHYAKLDIERLRLCALDTSEATGYFKQFLEGRGAI